MFFVMQTDKLFLLQIVARFRKSPNCSNRKVFGDESSCESFFQFCESKQTNYFTEAFPKKCRHRQCLVYCTLFLFNCSATQQEYKSSRIKQTHKMES